MALASNPIAPRTSSSEFGPTLRPPVPKGGPSALKRCSRQSRTLPSLKPHHVISPRNRSHVGTRQTRPAPKRFRPPRRRDAVSDHRRLARHLVRPAAAASANGAARGQGAAVGLPVRRQPQLYPALGRRDVLRGASRARRRVAAAPLGHRDPQGPDRRAELRGAPAQPQRFARKLSGDRSGHAFPRPPRPAPFVRGLAENAARGHAGHRRGHPLSPLQPRRLALCARRHRRGDDQAADRRGRTRARAARTRRISRSSRASPPPTSPSRNSSTCRATCARTGSTA